MTIIEALRSGKPFRRKGGKYWNACGDYFIYSITGASNDTDSDFHWRPNKKDLLADDWEVEEVYYPVTEEELADLLKYSAGAVSRDYVTELDDRVKARGPVSK